VAARASPLARRARALGYRRRDVRDGSGEAEVPRRRSEKDKECEVAVWLHRPHDDRCVSREGCEDFSKETGAALPC
jgi:hypothetical protein